MRETAKGGINGHRPVTGATGKLGTQSEALVDRGINVRAATRLTTGIKWTKLVQPVVFDYEDPGLHKAALDRITGLFLIAPPLDFEAPAKLIPFIDKAKEMGVKHVVFNSSLHADSDEQNPLRIVEKHLAKSGLAYTILRPNFFMENFTAWVPCANDRKWKNLYSGRRQQNELHFRQRYRRGDRHRISGKIFGTEYNLTGPEALSYGETAKISIRCLRKDRDLFSHLRKGDDAGSQGTGVPESAIQYILQLFALVRKGVMAEMTDAVRKVTGKAPSRSKSSPGRTRISGKCSRLPDRP